MRATTAFNRMLQIPGATVSSVGFTERGLEVSLRLRWRRLRCPCGWSTRACYDRRPERRWRHLDAGATKLYLVYAPRRLACRRCARVRTELVPWARPQARCSRDFEDVIGWYAQRMDRSSVQARLRVAWQTVTDAVHRVVADHLDQTRLNEVYRIGVDEISYRRGHQYLTVVADHDRDGQVLWAGEGRSSDTLAQFYAELGPERCAKLQAVSLDMGKPFIKATTEHAPTARQCIDPFHVIKQANDALDYARRRATNQAAAPLGTSDPAGYQTKNPRPSQAAAHAIKRLRWALLKDFDRLTDKQLDQLAELERVDHVLFRAWQLKEDLRDLYRLPEGIPPEDWLDLWIHDASTSGIPAMKNLARTIHRHRDGILAAAELGISNGRLEGLNSKIRLINHRGYGHHSAPALISMIHLTAGGISIDLPTKT